MDERNRFCHRTAYVEVGSAANYTTQCCPNYLTQHNLPLLQPCHASLAMADGLANQSLSKNTVHFKFKFKAGAKTHWQRRWTIKFNNFWACIAHTVRILCQIYSIFACIEEDQQIQLVCTENPSKAKWNQGGPVLG